MKYMLIIYGNQELWESLGPDVMAQEFEAFGKFNKKFHDTGELLGAYGNADAAATRLVSLTDGQPVVVGRAVPGDEGVPGVVVPAGRRQRGAGAGDRGGTALGQVPAGRGVADPA